MSIFSLVIVPILFALIFFWFIFGLIVFIIKFIGTNKIQDLSQKKTARKKVWNIVLYPIFAFILLIVVWTVVNVGFGATSHGS